MAYDTVANLISDAAIELGLVFAPVADAFASTDQNIVQLRQLLKSGGRDLSKRRDWSHLQKEYTFATVNGTESYVLPADYRSMIQNSGWNRTTQFPLGGPVGAEYWQYRKAVAVGGVIYLNVRIWKGQIFVEPTPTAAETVAFEYQSNYWCGVAAATLPNGLTKDAPTINTDVVFFDPLLVLRRLKLDWKKAKGFDTGAAQDDYDEALHAAEAEDSPSSTIYIGGRIGGVRRIDRFNVPDSGVGQ